MNKLPFKIDLETLLISSIKIAVVILGYLIIRLVISKIASRFLRPAIDRVADKSDSRSARIRTIQTMMRSGVDFILGFVALVMLLHILGLNIMPLITTAGVAGLAVGFGAQKLVRDIIGGFFIIMEDQFGVGDYISVGAVAGTVEILGMRTTSLRDSQGRLTIISNGLMEQVCNHSRGKYRIFADFPVDSKADPEAVRQALGSALEAVQLEYSYVVEQVDVVDGFVAVTGANRTYRCQVMVLPTEAEKVKSKLNELVAQQLAEAQIAMV